MNSWISQICFWIGCIQLRFGVLLEVFFCFEEIMLKNAGLCYYSFLFDLRERDHAILINIFRSCFSLQIAMCEALLCRNTTYVFQFAFCIPTLLILIISFKELSFWSKFDKKFNFFCDFLAGSASSLLTILLGLAIFLQRCSLFALFFYFQVLEIVNQFLGKILNSVFLV